MALLTETSVQAEAQVPIAVQNSSIEEHISGITDRETANQVRAFYDQFRGFEKR